VTQLRHLRPICDARHNARPRTSSTQDRPGGRQLGEEAYGHREIVSLLGCAAVAWPLAARAQRPAKLPTIGFLGASTPSGRSRWVPALERRHRAKLAGIEYRWTEGRSQRYAESCGRAYRLKADIIVTVGSTTPVTQQAIPIVFAAAVDPLGSGRLASLARRGGMASFTSKDCWTPVRASNGPLFLCLIPLQQDMACH
jgi:hypothetical protein